MTSNGRPVPRSCRLRVAAVIIAVVLMVAGCAGDDEAGEAGTDAGPPAGFDVEAIERTIDDHLGAEGTPGWVVLAWDGDDEVTSVSGSAQLDPQDPMEESATFPIRSITKSFTVTLLLQLVDEGLVTLEDPVAAYVDGVPGGDDITLGQLATMRSGLPDYTTDAFVQGLLDEPERVYTSEELLAFAFAEPASFAPGDGYEYSNTNTVLIGSVVEEVAGAPIEQRYAERIWEPVGLGDGTAYPIEGPLPDLGVLGYDVDPETLEAEPALPVSLSALGAAGGMVSTATDLRLWAEALVAGSLLEPGTQALRLAEAGPTDGGPVYDSYGLGIGEVAGWWGHTGEGIGFQTAVLRDPDRDAGVVILLNGAATGDTPEALARELIPLLGGSTDG